MVSAHLPASPRRSRIVLVSPLAPPCICGLADHSTHLAYALSSRADVTVFAGGGQPAAEPVEVRQVFSSGDTRSFSAITPALEATRPHWLVLQYDPFSYGHRYGLGLPLARVLRAARLGGTRCAAIVHESFLPAGGMKRQLLSLLLKRQLRGIVRCCEVVFAATEPWVERIARGRTSPSVLHLPVGSNIPVLPVDRDTVRNRLAIADDELVVALFGRARRTRSLGHVVRAVEAVASRGRRVVVLYTGASAEDLEAVRTSARCRVIGGVGLEPAEVSARLQAADVYVVPIDEGVSTRRSALMAGLSHGLPVVATWGSATDRILREADGRALRLVAVQNVDAFASAVADIAADHAQAASMAAEGKRLYQRNFDWPHIAGRLMDGLGERGTSPPQR